MATVRSGRDVNLPSTGHPADGKDAPLPWHALVDEPGTRGLPTIKDSTESQEAPSVESLLLAASSFRLAGHSRPAAMVPYLDAADAQLETAAPDNVISARHRALSTLVRAVAERSLGHLAESLDLLQSLSAQTKGGPFALHDRIIFTALIDLNRGICELLQSRCERARRSLSRALELAGDDLPVAARVEAHGCLAIVDILSGSIADAEAHLAAASEGETSFGTATVCGLPGRFARATLAVERGRANDLADDIERLIGDSGHTEYAPLALLMRANIERESHDLEATLDALERMQLALRDWDADSLPHVLHDLGSVDVMIRRQQSAAAMELLDDMEPDSQHALCLPSWKARVELANSNFERAAELVAPCVALGDRHAPRSFCYALAISAAAEVALGDNATADDRFNHLLGRLAINGLRRPVTILPTPLAERLLTRARVDELSPRAARVRDELVRSLPSLETSSAQPLSGRERLILSYLVRGYTQSQTAAELRVSPNTVKSQVRSLYRKLGVESRVGAIQRARALGINHS